MCIYSLTKAISGEGLEGAGSNGYLQYQSLSTFVESHRP